MTQEREGLAEAGWITSRRGLGIFLICACAFACFIAAKLCVERGGWYWLGVYGWFCNACFISASIYRDRIK